MLNKNEFILLENNDCQYNVFSFIKKKKLYKKKQYYLNS